MYSLLDIEDESIHLHFFEYFLLLYIDHLIQYEYMYQHDLYRENSFEILVYMSKTSQTNQSKKKSTFK